MAQAQPQLELVQRDRDAIARRVTAGDAARRDLDSAQAALSQAHAQATAAAARCEAARIALRTTFPSIPLPARAPALPEPVADDADAQRHIDHIVSRSHEIGAAEREAERLDRAALRARAERRPDPSVGLRWLDERGGEERSLGVVVSIPFGGAARSATADAQRASAEAGSAMAQSMRRMIQREAEQTVRHADAAWRLWRDSRQALEAVRASTTKVRRAYALGEAGIAELIAAQRQEQESALAESDARANALEAALLIRVDAHELWHDAGETTTPERSAGRRTRPGRSPQQVAQLVPGHRRHQQRGRRSAVPPGKRWCAIRSNTSSRCACPAMASAMTSPARPALTTPWPQKPCAK